MNISGSTMLQAPRDAVWAALQDPSVLVATIPGCEQLTPVGVDAYEMTLTAGIASIKGTYTGTVQLSEQCAPESYVLRAAGSGAPGTVEATARVRLSADGGGTRLDYDADAVVGGMIGGVGQRVIAGVAKRTAGDFFAAVERHLLEGPAVPAAGPAAEAIPTPGGGVAAPAVPAPYVRPQQAASPRRAAELLAAVAVGGGLVLAGVGLGWLMGSRGRR